MISAIFRRDGFERLRLRLVPGQPVDIVGDSSLVDFESVPWSARLGSNVSFQENPIEWAHAVAEEYSDGQRHFAELIVEDDPAPVKQASQAAGSGGDDHIVMGAPNLRGATLGSQEDEGLVIYAPGGAAMQPAVEDELDSPIEQQGDDADVEYEPVHVEGPAEGDADLDADAQAAELLAEQLAQEAAEEEISAASPKGGRRQRNKDKKKPRRRKGKGSQPSSVEAEAAVEAIPAVEAVPLDGFGVAGSAPGDEASVGDGEEVSPEYATVEVEPAPEPARSEIIYVSAPAEEPAEEEYPESEQTDEEEAASSLVLPDAEALEETLVLHDLEDEEYASAGGGDSPLPTKRPNKTQKMLRSLLRRRGKSVEPAPEQPPLSASEGAGGSPEAGDFAAVDVPDAFSSDETEPIEEVIIASNDEAEPDGDGGDEDSDSSNEAESVDLVAQELAAPAEFQLPEPLPEEEMEYGPEYEEAMEAAYGRMEGSEEAYGSPLGEFDEDDWRAEPVLLGEVPAAFDSSPEPPSATTGKKPRWWRRGAKNAPASAEVADDAGVPSTESDDLPEPELLDAESSAIVDAEVEEVVDAEVEVEPVPLLVPVDDDELGDRSTVGSGDTESGYSTPAGGWMSSEPQEIEEEDEDLRAPVFRESEDRDEPGLVVVGGTRPATDPAKRQRQIILAGALLFILVMGYALVSSGPGDHAPETTAPVIVPEQRESSRLPRAASEGTDTVRRDGAFLLFNDTVAQARLGAITDDDLRARLARASSLTLSCSDRSGVQQSTVSDAPLGRDGAASFRFDEIPGRSFCSLYIESDRVGALTWRNVATVTGG